MAALPAQASSGPALCPCSSSQLLPLHRRRQQLLCFLGKGKQCNSVVEVMSTWEQLLPSLSHPSTAAPNTWVTPACAQHCNPQGPVSIPIALPHLSTACPLWSSPISVLPCTSEQSSGSQQQSQLSQVPSAGRGLMPRQALEFVTHGLAPRWGITPACREGRSCLSGLGSLGTCGAGRLGAGCGGAKRCPQPCRGPIAQSEPQLLLWELPGPGESSPAQLWCSSSRLPALCSQVPKSIGAVLGSSVPLCPTTGGCGSTPLPTPAPARCVSLCTFLLCREGCYATSGS